MHIHILGICGTFMGSLALLARQLGYRVSGADSGVYPPMSEQLAAEGIALHSGYDSEHLQSLAPDRVVIGNALSRGNSAVEAVLESGLPYCSGPEWLAEHVLRDRWVLAVAGTHGKTTTASMLAWILQQAGLQPGYLIGGVPSNFSRSATLGAGRYFVVEADEYDSAFFDKRSKFLHYRPRTLILNNLEFDHADIFDDLAAIQRQFHHLIRTVPSGGKIILPQEAALETVLQQGCWSSCEYLSGDDALWQSESLAADQSEFSLSCHADNATPSRVSWSLCGEHNRRNALAAVAAARSVGVSVADSAAALNQFSSVKRRLERLAEVGGITVYDDFAHHPTAIATTLAALRARVTAGRVLAIIEPRSNTMRMGVHNDRLPQAVADADGVWWCAADQAAGSLRAAFSAPIERLPAKLEVLAGIEDIIAQVLEVARAGDSIVVMSNGGFDGIHQRLIDALTARLSPSTLSSVK